MMAYAGRDDRFRLGRVQPSTIKSNGGTKQLPTNRQNFHIDHKLMKILHQYKPEDLPLVLTCLSDEMTKENYKEGMSTLLWIEEYYSALWPENLEFEQVSRSPRSPIFPLEVAFDLSPKDVRQSTGKLEENDRVLLVKRIPGSDSWEAYTGQVMMLSHSTTLPTRLCISIHTKENNGMPSDGRYDIYYRPRNGGYYKRHLAVRHMFDYHSQTLMLTTSGGSSTGDNGWGNRGNVELFDKQLDSDQRHVVNKLVNSFSITNRNTILPFIITGCAGTGKSRLALELALQITVTTTWSTLLYCGISEKHTAKFMEQFISHSDAERFIYDSGCVFLVSNQNAGHIPECLQEYAVSIKNLGTHIKSRIFFTTPWIAANILDYYEPKEYRFTHIIMDDCGMLSEPETLIPMTLIQKDQNATVILLGDEKQLGPEVGCDFSGKYGLQKKQDKNSMVLRNNHRNVEPIMSLASEMFFGSTVNFLAKPNPLLKGKNAVCFYAVNGSECHDRNGIFNDPEVKSLVNYLKKVYGLGFKHEDVGIITQFNVQNNLIKNQLKQEKINLPKTDHVDNYVGDEKEVILIGIVESAPSFGKWSSSAHGFIGSPEVSYTAISRARSHLFVTGNPQTMERDTFWRQFLAFCKQTDCYKVLDLNDCGLRDLVQKMKM